MDARRSETWFFVTLLAAALFLTWLILLPYLGALVISGTLAFLFYPLYRKLSHVFKNDTLAACGIVVIVALIVFAPLGYFGTNIFGEATALYYSISQNGGINNLTATASSFLAHYAGSADASRIILSINEYSQQGLAWLVQHVGVFFSGLAQLLFMAFLSLLGLFYFLTDGHRLKKWAFETIPLAPEYSNEILNEIESVTSSVVKGTLVVALLQGIVMGIGFFIFGIPNATFWGAFVVLASIIPIVGTWLVVVPAVAYLFIVGQNILAVGLIIWSGILVNVIYNVVSPQLMHRGVDIHPYLILLGVLGGLALFGPIGFLLGPLVIALLFSLLKIYTKLTVKKT